MVREVEPKKVIDQSVFKTSWPIKIVKAIFTLSLVEGEPLSHCFHTNQALTPISKNNVVQTGPNTHAGGLRAGFTIPAYQPAMDGVIKNAPIIPATSETTSAMTNLKKLSIFMSLLFQHPYKLQFVRVCY